MNRGLNALFTRLDKLIIFSLAYDWHTNARTTLTCTHIHSIHTNHTHAYNTQIHKHIKHTDTHTRSHSQMSPHKQHHTRTGQLSA